MFTKILFKRKFIKILKEEIWKEEINLDFAGSAIPTIEKLNVERSEKILELEGDVEKLKDSTTKEDRDRSKEIKALIQFNRDMITANEKMMSDTKEAIDEKKTKIDTLTRKIQFIKENF